MFALYVPLRYNSVLIRHLGWKAGETRWIHLLRVFKMYLDILFQKGLFQPCTSTHHVISTKCFVKQQKTQENCCNLRFLCFPLAALVSRPCGFLYRSAFNRKKRCPKRKGCPLKGIPWSFTASANLQHSLRSTKKFHIIISTYSTHLHSR